MFCSLNVLVLSPGRTGGTFMEEGVWFVEAQSCESLVLNFTSPLCSAGPVFRLPSLSTHSHLQNGDEETSSFLCY